jgi:predicted O-methyltransferase YrrM
MKVSIKQVVRRIANRGLWVPPGHYYSPIPSQRDCERPVREPVAIDLRRDEQLALADKLRPLVAQSPTGRQPGWRWHGPNNMFGQPDAGVYYAMLALLRPSRVVEVGSGFSTAIALDAVDRHGLETTLTCVEPNPQRLRSLLRPGDRVEVVERPAQDVDVGAFAGLRVGDVLFVDSTHVAKTGSDVLFLLLQVIPSLTPGVVVHVHDIHWPFTYPKRWLEEGRAWNETYLLQSLLIQPSCLRIMLWGSYLAKHGRPEFKGGGSIWLERV